MNAAEQIYPEVIHHPMTQASNEASQPESTEPDFATIVQLQKLAREQTTTADLAFVTVNNTHRLVPFFQAFLWNRPVGGSARLIAASGVSDIDRHAPVVRFVEQFIASFIYTGQHREQVVFDIRAFADDVQDGWLEWLPEYAVWCPFRVSDHDVSQGLLITSDKPFSPVDCESLECVVDGYAHAWHALQLSRTSSRTKFTQIARRSRWIPLVMIAVVACLFLPVRFSVLAGARVVPVDPVIVAAPIDGVIDQVAVKPNQSVVDGDLLFEFNPTQARSNYELAESEFRIALADYELSIQKSFTDASSKADSETLALLVEEKRLAANYAKLRLDQTKVYAEHAGIAVFIDANNWKGRPVSTGERIMTIANPDNIELQVELATEDAGAVLHQADVEFFLDTDPNNPMTAAVRQIAYESELSASGELVYPIKAQFRGPRKAIRLGLKGTAKVYGEQVSLFYYLFRKPWSVVRQYLSL